MKKAITLIYLCLIITLSFGIKTKADTLKDIETSDKITIKSKVFSLKRVDYNVYSDGQKVGTIKGKTFSMFGDTLKV